MSTQQSYPTKEEARALLVDIGRRMYQNGYVVTNDGNLSLKVAENEILVTPTGVSKGYMREGDMVHMDLGGAILSGTAVPSSEVKMHLRVYRESPTATAVVHAHPTAATSFAIAGIPLDLPIMIEASLQLGAVPIARYATPGTDGVADSIAPYCKDYAGVLLSNHGALTWGRTLLEAYYRLEIMENYAKTTLNLMTIGKTRLLSCEQMGEIQALKRHYAIPDGMLQKGADNPQNLTDVLPQVVASK